MQAIADLLDSCLLLDPEKRPSAEQIFQVLQEGLGPGQRTSALKSGVKISDADKCSSPCLPVGPESRSIEPRSMEQSSPPSSVPLDASPSRSGESPPARIPFEALPPGTKEWAPPINPFEMLR